MNLRIAISALVFAVSSLGSALASVVDVDAEIALGYSGTYQSSLTTLVPGSTFSGATYSFYDAGLPVEVTANGVVHFYLFNFGLDPTDGSGSFQTDVSLALLDASGNTVYSDTYREEIAVSTQGLAFLPGNVTFSSAAFSLSPAFPGVADYPFNGNTRLPGIQLRLYSVTDVERVSPPVVPLPAGLPLLAGGLGLLAGLGARRRRRG